MIVYDCIQINFSSSPLVQYLLLPFSKFSHDIFLCIFCKKLAYFVNKIGQVKKPMQFFYLLFTAHCVMMHWKSHSQVFTRLDDAGERRWATAANPTQGCRNVGNFGGHPTNPNLTKTLHAGGQLDSILDPEDPTRPEIGFKFILKVQFLCWTQFWILFQVNPIQLVYSRLRDQLDLMEP